MGQPAPINESLLSYGPPLCVFCLWVCGGWAGTEENIRMLENYVAQVSTAPGLGVVDRSLCRVVM